jgi:ADP-ribosyl-[dinitrogen reductase] hydrolase
MPHSEITPLDRHLGCLIGLATGDALGTTLEFKPPGSFTPIDDMVGGGPFRLEPGQWTDDTSMALCLAESLLEKSGYDPHDQCQRYAEWMRHGHLSSNGRCFDIGNTVSQALRTFLATGNPYSGPDGEYEAGNGSIMRLAPVPLWYSNDAEAAIHHSGESSRTTHQSPASIDACRYMGGILVALLQGATKDQVLKHRFHPIHGTWPAGSLCPKIDTVASGSFKTKQPPEIRGTGYVVASLEAALWAFHHSESFREGALLAVNLGDDADTTGAIFGQIAGAYYGINGIPAEWRDKLALKQTLLDFATRLFDRSSPRMNAIQADITRLDVDATPRSDSEVEPVPKES